MNAHATLATRISSIRGTFGVAAHERQLGFALAILFGIGFPLLFSYLLVVSATPIKSWNGDLWTCAALAIASPVMAYFFLWAVRRRWQFTESEIVAWYGSKVGWRLTYAEVTSAEVLPPSRGVRTLRLRSPNETRELVLSDPELIRRISIAFD